MKIVKELKEKGIRQKNYLAHAPTYAYNTHAVVPYVCMYICMSECMYLLRKKASIVYLICTYTNVQAYIMYVHYTHLNRKYTMY